MEIDRVKTQIAAIVDASSLRIDDKAALLFALSFELVRATYGTRQARDWALRMVDAGIDAHQVKFN